MDTMDLVLEEEYSFFGKENVMRKSLIILLIPALVFAGCGGRQASPIQVYRPGDNNRGCESLKVEMAQLQADMQQILPKTDKSGTNIICGVTGAFLIVPLFFMDFKGADKIEFDAMRNRHNALLAMYVDKNCDMEEGMEPIPSDKAMKEMLKAEKKKAAEGDTDSK